MPRPKSKVELIELGNQNFNKLNEFVDQFSDFEKEAKFSKGMLNRNFRDVLTHLHHWHLLMLGWYKVGMAGEKPTMPAEGYTWKTLPDFNKKVWEQYQTTSLKEARKLLNNSFLEVQKIIQKHTDAELFEKKRYKWTGSTSLGAYLISNTSSHYDWALKLMKKAKK